VRSYIADPLAMGGWPMTMLADEFFTDGIFKAFATRGGVRYQRWADQFGFDFRELVPRRPAIADWFTEREARGAVFVEEGEGVALSPETWVETMIWRR
jgi:hypothetical protein